MSELTTRIFICAVVIVFLSASLILAKPVSDGGRLARKLCIANAAGWLFILPLSNTGDPPPFLIPLTFFWLINLVLLPAAAFALWASYRQREERIPYLAVASSYIVVNLAILFVIPVVWFVREVSH